MKPFYGIDDKPKFLTRRKDFAAGGSGPESIRGHTGKNRTVY